MDGRQLTSRLYKYIPVFGISILPGQFSAGNDRFFMTIDLKQLPFHRLSSFQEEIIQKVLTNEYHIVAYVSYFK